MKFKSKTKKSLAILLTMLTLFGACPNSSALPNPAQKIRRYLQTHKRITNLIKGAAAAGVVAVAGLGLYLLGQKALDKLDPTRKITRENAKKAKMQLPKLQKELLDEKTTEERKKQLCQDISSRREIISQAEKNRSSTLDNIPVISGAAACSTAVLSVLNNLGNISEKILHISFLNFAYQHMTDLKNIVKKQFEAEATQLSKDEVFKRFETSFKGIEGQEKAVRDVKNHLYDIVVAKDQAKWKKEKYSHGDVLYFHGVSGVGKTSLSNKVAQTIYSNPKIYTITSSDVDKDKKESVVSQLFGSKQVPIQGRVPQQIQKSGGIAEFLKQNPNGIVRIEEYDKFCTPALDEVLRAIVDCGTINVDGEKVDCSGILFIVTSNEDNVSMQGFEKSETKPLEQESVKQGYTRVWHDKSFLNRIRKVEFKNLGTDSYEAIFREHFDQLSKYWSAHANGGIKLKIDDKSVKALALEIEKASQGAHSVDRTILPEIKGEIGNKIKSAPSLDFYKGKTFNITYSPETKKFEIKES